MEMEIAVKKVRCVKRCVKWRTKFPLLDWKIESARFQLEDHSWKFLLERKYYLKPKEEYWTLYIMNSELGFGADFSLSMFVADKNDKHVFLGQKIVHCGLTEIWSVKLSNLTYQYPTVDFRGDKVLFAAVCDFGYNSFKELKTASRGVQTSPYLDDLVCLKRLSSDLGSLQDCSDSKADLQLKCGPESVPVHSAVLRARSEVFRAMLDNDMRESREGVVEIVDMEPRAFKMFCQFLYTGIIPEMSPEVMRSLYEAGDKYQVTALRKRCGDYLADNLKPGNACEVLALADAHCDTELRSRALHYVLKKEVPRYDESWFAFSEEHPMLANEVLYHAYLRLADYM